MTVMEESSFLIPSVTLQAAHLEEGMQVADFGAGSGFFTIAAAGLVGASGVVWAVDMQPELLTRIKNHAEAAHHKNVEIVRGDLEASKGSNLPAEQFDLVIVTNILFSLEDKPALIQEAWRVLKQDGQVLVVDWRDSFDGMGPHQDHIITAGVARDLFEKSGFSYVGDAPAGGYHWGFLVRKNHVKGHE